MAKGISLIICQSGLTSEGNYERILWDFWFSFAMGTFSNAAFGNQTITSTIKHGSFRGQCEAKHYKFLARVSNMVEYCFSSWRGHAAVGLISTNRPNGLLGL
jgi:hypothetical protein